MTRVCCLLTNSYPLVAIEAEGLSLSWYETRIRNLPRMHSHRGEVRFCCHVDLLTFEVLLE